MWPLLIQLVESPAFLTLMFIILFGIVGYLFKYKLSKERFNTEMASIKEHFDDQKVDLARIEKRLWDLGTGKDQMPLDPGVEKRANDNKGGK